jgi:hypothetical protein
VQVVKEAHKVSRKLGFIIGSPGSVPRTTRHSGGTQAQFVLNPVFAGNEGQSRSLGSSEKVAIDDEAHTDRQDVVAVAVRQNP